MNPIRKRFDEQPTFPFSLAYKDTKTSQSELPDHLHDWYEIVYVHRGNGTFFIDRTLYDMREGDLFAIPGNTIHRAFPDKDDPVTSSAVFFSPIMIQSMTLGESFSYLEHFDQCRMHKSYKLSCAPGLQNAIEADLNEIEAELRNASPGYRHAVSLLLHRMLLHLNREVGGNRKQAGTTNLTAIGPDWMKEILLYIDGHLADPIGLRELSARASVSPPHFSRLFKQLTGMNVTDFIATKRIIKAKELLLDTRNKVEPIAYECGFESMPHFHRMFKRIVGMTPAAYRRNPHHVKEVEI